MVQAIDSFHKTRLGYLVFGVVELALSAVIAHHMLMSGNWWEYGIAFILFIGFVQNAIKVALNK